RRFLRHPAVKAYLQRRFPDIFNPTLIELHTSLANRSHLEIYITTAKAELFPAGTGWKGPSLSKHFRPPFHLIGYFQEFSV
ncbi:hypothetical protein B0H14DRAFT_2346807, partial [Mycena olivaceomarginata]